MEIKATEAFEEPCAVQDEAISDRAELESSEEAPSLETKIGNFLAAGMLTEVESNLLLKALSRASDLVTTMKKIVWLCLGNGILWVWCSYILAALGKEQIAEDLSKVAVTEIIAVVLVYALKSLFENLSKHNKWPDKPDENDVSGLG